MKLDDVIDGLIEDREYSFDFDLAKDVQTAMRADPRFTYATATAYHAQGVNFLIQVSPSVFPAALGITTPESYEFVIDSRDDGWYFGDNSYSPDMEGPIASMNEVFTRILQTCYQQYPYKALGDEPN